MSNIWQSTEGSRALRHARGFTLIEIMVVVIIIGLLAAVIVPQVISKVDEARVAKAKQDIQSLETALTMFRLDNSKYPTTEQGLAALVSAPGNDPKWRGPYLGKSVPNDPWGRPFSYRSPAAGKEFEIMSYGKDGSPGGLAEDADIVY